MPEIQFASMLSCSKIGLQVETLWLRDNDHVDTRVLTKLIAEEDFNENAADGIIED